MQLAAVLNKQWHAGNRHLTPSRITALSLEMHKNQPFYFDQLGREFFKNAIYLAFNTTDLENC